MPGCKHQQHTEYRESGSERGGGKTQNTALSEEAGQTFTLFNGTPIHPPWASGSNPATFSTPCTFPVLWERHPTKHVAAPPGVGAGVNFTYTLAVSWSVVTPRVSFILSVAGGHPECPR